MDEIKIKIENIKSLCSNTDMDINKSVVLGILDILDDMNKIIAKSIDNNIAIDLPIIDAKFMHSYTVVCPDCEADIEVDYETFNDYDDVMCLACGKSVPIVGVDMDDLIF